VRQHPKRKMSDLFSAAYRKRTLAVATLWATCGFIQYGLSTWLPTIYKNFYHAPLQLALNLAVIGSVMGVFGSLASALLVDKLGRKPVIVWSFVLCALSLAFAGIYHASSVYVVAIFCSLSLGLMASGFITAYVYTPEQYPTTIRASGCGLGSAWLKIASFVAPMVVPHAIIGGNLAPAFYLIGIVPLIAAVTVHFVGIETKGKVLEALEA
jgi:MFS family permease